MVWWARHTYHTTGGQQSPMVVREGCPACGSPHFKPHGHLHTGQQHHPWQACGRPCGLDAATHVMAAAQRTLVERLLRENIALHGIWRAVGVSSRWLRDCRVARFQALPEQLPGPPMASPRDVLIGRLEAEADELGSFGKQQPHRPWGWMAIDRQRRPIIAFHVGDRRRERARQRWANLQEVSRRPATFDTDPSDASPGGRPAERHQAITKDARKTNHLECFNNMLPQRLSRLVRETLAFSKKVENHIGAIRYFICYYNLARATALPV